MGYLQNTSIYLSGAVEAHQTPDTWRNKIAPKLSNLGLKVYDPLIKPEWMPAITPTQQASWKSEIYKDNNGQIMLDNMITRQWCLALTYSCNMMIVKLEKKIFTAGTFEEIKIARDCNKPIFVICDDKIPSMWLVDQLDAYGRLDDVFFTSDDELINHLSDINERGRKALINANDYLRWIFITHNM